MVLSEVLDLFTKHAPAPVMVRALMENALSTEHLDQLFADNARRQRPSDAAFSLMVDLMGAVVCGVRPSMHAAFQAKADQINVSLAAIYAKLQGIELGVSQALVRDSADQLGQIVDHMGGRLPDWLPGFRVKILDGNHLPRSERRIKELRGANVAPLPGHTLVVLDPTQQLVIDAFACEDGFAQERSLLAQVLATLEQGDVLIADRNFCTTDFVSDIADLKAGFVIRQHASSLRHELREERRELGRIDTGVVFEQPITIFPNHGQEWRARRVSVVLDNPTRKGDAELHVITNLPDSVDAKRVAELYARRWKIETAFQELQATLHGELKALGYPKAALFAFAIALMSYNLLSTVKAALRAEHGVEKVEQEVSGFYLADDVSGNWRGMLQLLPPDVWHERFADLSPKQMAQFLRRAARHVSLAKFKKHPRGPKKKTTKHNKKKIKQVSTARVIKQSRDTTKASC